MLANTTHPHLYTCLLQSMFASMKQFILLITIVCYTESLSGVITYVTVRKETTVVTLAATLTET